MSFVEARLWLDAADAERDERIGEHECYITLFDDKNNRYLGNSMWWSDALEPFLTVDLRDVIGERFRVVPRCRCDQTWCPDEEWTGPKLEILRDRRDIIDFDATQEAAVREWRGHVEQLRATVADRLTAAARQRGNYLVAVDTIAALDSAERFAAIRTARATLDALEVEAVKEERRKARSWTEIGVQLGTSKQAAHERFAKYDQEGSEAA